MDDENEQRKTGMKVNNMNITNGMEANGFQWPEFKIKKSNKLLPKFNKTIYHIFGTSM